MKTFEEWMKEVDDWLTALCGSTSSQLPEAVSYVELHKQGLDPETAAQQSLEACDWGWYIPGTE